VTDADPRMRIVHALRAVTVELDLAGARFAGRQSIHATDLRALIQILDGPRAGAQVTPTWLSHRLNLTSAATTAVIDRLAAAGLVHRAGDPSDRRRVVVAPTDAAMALGRRFFGPLIDAMVAALGAFGPDELDVIGRFLATVTEAVTGRPT
jgi:DNA-binding MarR family transcriptional regulator